MTEFTNIDAVTHVSNFQGKPVRVASGDDDPFHSGVVAFVAVAPRSTQVTFEGGCHTPSFFLAQQPPSLAFLGQHLA